MSRSHSTCELCRAGVAKSGDTHRDTIPGTAVERFRRCTAQCSHCLETIKAGELFREIPIPDGTVEVHDRCMR